MLSSSVGVSGGSSGAPGHSELVQDPRRPPDRIKRLQVLPVTIVLCGLSGVCFVVNKDPSLPALPLHGAAAQLTDHSWQE